MDGEIVNLPRRRRCLRGYLRRDHRTGCLEYTGPAKGGVEGNPMLSVRKNGRTTVKLLRRVHWEERHGPLPAGKVVVMRCGNHRCHAWRHMVESQKTGPYRRNCYLNTPQIFTRNNVLLMRYFQGWIGQTALARWFGIRPYHVTAIWEGKVFQKFQLPSNFVPPIRWQKKAERYSNSTPSGHYLTEKNRTAALRDIRTSDLPRKAKGRLIAYVSGESTTSIAIRQRRTRETLRSAIRYNLRLLRARIGDREWLRFLIKKRLPKRRNPNLF